MQFRDQQDKIDRYINSYATQSFRDQGDRDYIAARLACRAELMPQFLWAAQQAVEKYLKGVLLYNRVKVPKLTHDLNVLLALTRQLPAEPFSLDLRPQSREFIEHLAEYGANRYLEKPYFVDGYVHVELDVTVWDLRRYCQVLNVFGKALPPAEAQLILDSLEDLSKSSIRSPHEFRLHGGLLEEILSKPNHPARAGLVWNNAMYSSRKRSKIRARDLMYATNTHLYNYPEMLDELLKFSPLPGELIKAYRAHFAAIQADPSIRP